MKRVATGIFLLLIRVYRAAISPLLGPTCRYTPSCSAYAEEAIGRFGPWRGGWMGVRRVARCSSLVEHGLMPAVLGSGVGYAFLVSVLTNLLFGPQMMAFHRWEDNLILRRRGYAGIQRAWWTLIWFWIPAHTVTFSLPKDLQIGLSAAGSRKSQAAPAKARTAP